MVKQKDVTNYWEEEVCGTRFSNKKDKNKYFQEIAYKRYKAEPYIREFAFGDCEDFTNKKILEIGVGAGTDFVEFLRRDAICFGIDATDSAIQKTHDNILNSFKNKKYKLEYLEKANAEKLPFQDNTFDMIYSHGVLHHAKNTMSCIAEAYRVLKPGGKLKIMVYSDFSATGIMLWMLYGLAKGKPFLSQEEIIFKYLESPGTKCYSKKELLKILKGFGLQKLILKKFASSGDLLLMPRSKKYQKNLLYNLIQFLYPRLLVKKLESILGLSITVTADKPEKI
ncbi:class I SAM-dependent methyltransferase [Prochlorococcus marinus XMU1411]|uniref:class I SAM-dependent methyltransferase n=1 Tax=Prochlorococcus marinus TaxID=1219 RepID=UPI001ADADF64|nr:class I SAM-dependent methyltransferase [Prochlorococcus marinus]MBO8244247.1 class I SAM-dependent methyltransferase [Prochlorococcus marinus XMU1411]MBW3055333.1 hypothetical protein [Prochlorococcus marinus str. MU1411]MCR8537075.1 class I SAM-dependent methyltransferase [Prochlorococcus marinus CUG1430]